MPDPAPPHVVSLDGSERDPRIGRARKWLVAISVIFVISGLVLYTTESSEASRVIRDSERELAGYNAEERDQIVMSQMGMTWDEWVADVHQQVTLDLLMNLGLAASFLGLFFYAKRHPYNATVAALLLYLSVILLNAYRGGLQTLPQGIIIKVLFIGALVKAIKAAKEERGLIAQAKIR